MKDNSNLGALEQVRAARHRISKRFDHDPRKLVEHYMELQQEYKDRLVGLESNTKANPARKRKPNKST